MIIKKLIPKANYTNKLQDIQYIQTKPVCFELITASFQAIPNEVARPRRRRKKKSKEIHSFTSSKRESLNDWFPFSTS